MQRRLEQLPDSREGLDRVSHPTRAVVVGGGLSGISAAINLAERGVQTTLLEANAMLGGRLSAWDDCLKDGESVQMSRGFHAFFRQYYNLRNLLRRVDPELRMLTPLPDYPILGRYGAFESFARLPKLPPFNLLELTRRTPTLSLSNLLKVDVRRALSMLAYDGEKTYEAYDKLSAKAFLDSLNFPTAARTMLFDVFAHSFFSPEAELSAAELLMMFHFYFTGSREGLLFDVLNRPFSTAFWQPMQRHVSALGVDVQLASAARSVQPTATGFEVQCEGRKLDCELLVIALSVPALQALVDASAGLAHPGFRHSVQGLGVARPFVVWRLWLDRPALRTRHGFAGTSAFGRLDNLSLFDVFEDESRSWAVRNDGSVLELHAYAVAPDFDPEALKAELWQATQVLYPEFEHAKVRDERFLVKRDCSSFEPGSYAQRPGVETPFRGLALAGDFVKLPMPSALMERATAAGLIASNHLLRERQVRGAPVYTVPQRGLLAFTGLGAADPVHAAKLVAGARV